MYNIFTHVGVLEEHKIDKTNSAAICRRALDGEDEEQIEEKLNLKAYDMVKRLLDQAADCNIRVSLYIFLK